MAFFRLFCVVLGFRQILGQLSGQFNMTAYREMPSLYHFEDYDACLGVGDEEADNITVAGNYCMVFAEITPNETSALWRRISEFSSDHKRHFRHDHLFFGVCLERCKRLLQPLSDFRIRQLYGGRPSDREITGYYFDVHKRDTDERVRHDHFVSSCLNYDFHHKYYLTLRTSIEYCESSSTPLKHDTLDVTVYSIFALIALLNTFSTLFDRRLKSKQPLNGQNNNFYKTEPKSTVHTLLTSFSLCRNYYRLTLSSRSKLAQDLKFLNAFRVVGVFLVIFAHVLMLYMAVQIDNPQFFEKFLYRVETSIIQNGSAIIQIFFIMSGFLLSVNFLERKPVTSATKVTDCIAVFFKLFVYRYLRLMPSLIILILFNATILIRLQDGPFWRHYVEAERVFCREYAWKNLFFINNYLMKESCAHQTWYIAADMQLFELFLFILILTAKYPKVKMIIYGSLLFLAITIPAMITYYLKLDAIYHLKPENYRYMFFKDAETFYQTYTPFYTNIGGYLFGLLCAEIYTKSKSGLRRPSFYRGAFKYELSWWLLFPAGLALLFSGALFMSYDFERPSIWVALYAGFYRNLWVLLCCGALLGMCFKLGWIAYEFCCLSFFHPLAKISYQAYLWHVVVLRLMVGYYRQPIYINRLSLICNIAVAFIFTNLLAMFLALFVEYPIAEVVSCLLKKCKNHGKGDRKKEVFVLSEGERTTS